MGVFMGLSAVGALALLALLFLPERLLDGASRFERSPWLTWPGLAGALTAAGIVGGLVLERTELLPAAGLAALTTAALTAVGTGWLDNRLRRRPVRRDG